MAEAAMQLSDPLPFSTDPEAFSRKATEFGCPGSDEQVERMTAYIRKFL